MNFWQASQRSHVNKQKHFSELRPHQKNKYPVVEPIAPLVYAPRITHHINLSPTNMEENP